VTVTRSEVLLPAGRNLRSGTLAVILTALLLPSLKTDAELLEGRLRTESRFLESPPGELRVEFARIRPAHYRPVLPLVEPASGTVYQHSAEVDVNELWETLSEGGLTDAEGAAILGYSKARQQIAGYAEANAPYLYNHKPTGPPAAPVPGGLPAEFALYLQGALAYANDDQDVARESWLKLMERPPDQRRHRSVWAAYMLGRCPPDSVTDDWSLKWYQRCRALAADGFTDKLGLAEASYGWEAKLYFEAGHDAEAIDLYLTQLACGDVSAIDSLAIVAQTVFAAGDARLAAIGESSAAVGVLCAFMGAGGGPFRDPPKPDAVRPWLRSLSTARPDLAPVSSHIAWAAYASDDFAAAQRWVAIAGQKDARAEWIRSRLLIRNGQLGGAVTALHNAAAIYNRKPTEHWTFPTRASPVAPGDQCLAEAGVVLLAMGKYVEAFQAFYDTGYRDGIDFVAERVLTADELCAVDRSRKGNPSTRLMIDSQIMLDSLCTRRLVRLGRWDDACQYDARARPFIDAYRDALRRGDDPDAYAEDRAAALWEAAGLAHREGYRLFYRSSSDNARWRDDSNWTHLRRGAEETARFIASERQEMSPNYPTQVAGTLAWRAAELLPDEDDQTARILNMAGRWYGVSDNARADRFYKALVRRCGTTQLGRRADRLGWFAP
jgi:hypothetical protein